MGWRWTRSGGANHGWREGGGGHRRKRPSLQEHHGALDYPPYRGSSLIRNGAPLGPYSRTMPCRALRWSYGGAVFYERGTPVIDQLEVLDWVLTTSVFTRMLRMVFERYIPRALRSFLAKVDSLQPRYPHGACSGGGVGQRWSVTASPERLWTPASCAGQDCRSRL